MSTYTGPVMGPPELTSGERTDGAAFDPVDLFSVRLRPARKWIRQVQKIRGLPSQATLYNKQYLTIPYVQTYELRFAKLIQKLGQLMFLNVFII